MAFDGPATSPLMYIIYFLVFSVVVSGRCRWERAPKEDERNEMEWNSELLVLNEKPLN